MIRQNAIVARSLHAVPRLLLLLLLLTSANQLQSIATPLITTSTWKLKACSQHMN